MNERQAPTVRRWDARPRGDCKAKDLWAFWRLDGERFDIRAKVARIGGYLAHADQQGLVEFVAGRGATTLSLCPLPLSPS